MKRTISLILALFMLCGLIPFSVLTVSAAGDAVISVENVSATVNSTVDVAISISGNTGIASMGIILTFDSSLVLVGAQNGEAFSELTMTPPSQLKNGGSVTGSCRFAWLGTDNVTDDGVILNLKFRVSDDAQLNKDCVVSVVCENVFDEGRNSVTVSTVDGAVKVINYIPGDVDGNGVINMLDVLTLCQYYVDAEGYGVNINPLAGDVDANGMVNMLDVLMVCQYYVDAEGYNVTLLPGKVSCSHELQNVPAKDATCTEAGNIAYFTCTKCGKYFSDAEGKTEITAKETVIAMKGHTEVIDEAVAPTYTTTGKTEGSHCSVCNKILREQTEIPMLEAKYHSVTYRNTKDAVIPAEKMKYAEHEGLAELPKPEANGYDFIGWSENEQTYIYPSKNDVPDSFKSISDISAGDTTDYKLYAHWAYKNYTITYKNAPGFSKQTYTIDDEIELESPSWVGLIFDRWVYDSGKEIKDQKIEKGTTGDITITAKWKQKENIATEKTTDKPVTLYDNGKWYFIYDLGTIDNIVVDRMGAADKGDNQPLHFEDNVTVSIEKSVVDSVAKGIGTSISHTNEWSEANTKGGKKSKTDNWNASGEVEFNIKDVFKIKGGGSGGTSHTDESSWSSTTQEGGSDGVVGSTEDTWSSTVSYVQGRSVTFGKALDVPDYMPAGTYTYACVGKVSVYAVVVYDEHTQNYNICMYSIMDDNYRQTVLYEPLEHDKQKYDISENPPLAYKLPGNAFDVRDYATYNVVYDANGGEGTMMNSVFFSGCSHSLQKNTFERSGYQFIGWKLQNDQDRTIFADEQVVCDIAAAREEVTLVASWGAKVYSVTYDANQGTLVPGDTEEKRVVFGQPYGVLPRVEREGYTFMGWCLANGENVTPETEVACSSDHKLIACWSANTYTLNFDPTGGELSLTSKEVVYDSSYGDLPEPSRNGYAFVGWYSEPSGGERITEDTQVEFLGVKTVYAHWIPFWRVEIKRMRELTFGGKKWSFNFDIVKDTDDTVEDHITLDYFNLAEIKELGYTKFKMTITFAMNEIDDGYQEFWVSNNEETFWYVEFEHGPGYLNESKQTYTFSSDNLDLNLLSDNGSFKIKYGAHGKNEDDWAIYDTIITVTAVK